ncbi:hypothetical protein [Streptomyces fagopyri]
MNRRLGMRLSRLEEAAPKPSETPWCRHHGPACQMGAEPLSDLYVLIIEAKRSVGQPVPPLDEHVPMTAAERIRYEQEVTGLIAEKKAENDAAMAELRGEVL